MDRILYVVSMYWRNMDLTCVVKGGDLVKYLQEILFEKKKEIKKLKKTHILDDKTGTPLCYCERPGKSLVKNIDRSKVNVIAEIKRASPSSGVINDAVDIKKMALLYERYSSFVKGISILTEPIYFKGNLSDIEKVKEVTNLPILRKDFIFHEEQVYESLKAGANCILLISSILGTRKLKKLYQLGKKLGLDVLVEVHSFDELDRAFDIGAEFIGINNRNLKNMKVDHEVTVGILDYANKRAKRDIKEKIFVCESGIEDIGYIKKVFEKGVSTFLIGGYFMRSKNPDETLATMEKVLKKEFLI